jgi:hypothetical protein
MWNNQASAQRAWFKSGERVSVNYLPARVRVFIIFCRQFDKVLGKFCGQNLRTKSDDKKVVLPR